jgi:hypothetical protein
VIAVRDEPGILSQTQRRRWYPKRQQRHCYDCFQPMHGKQKYNAPLEIFKVINAPLRSSASALHETAQFGSLSQLANASLPLRFRSNAAQARGEQRALDSLREAFRSTASPIVEEKDTRLLVGHVRMNGNDVYCTDPQSF